MRRLLLLLFALLALEMLPASASAAPPLHGGDRGQRVKNLQWLLSGHKPSVYWRTVRTYDGAVDGIFGPQTAAAVRGAKWRLGYPKHAVNARAGRQLFEFLLGKRARPLGWIGVASKRVHAGIGKPLSCAARAVAIARSQLGVHEVPDGSNDGPRVRMYQRVTGAFLAPWCASFVQWVYVRAGIGMLRAQFPAHVFTIVRWAHEHAMVHALPRKGAAVAFLRSLGHIGIVERVTKTGFYTIEGNTSNGVYRRWYPTGYQHTVFIYPPCP
jgi:hypothetical protein